MRTRLVVGLIIAAFVILSSLPLVSAAENPTASTTTTTSTSYQIALQPDGSAEWTVEYRTPLSSDDDVSAFQAYSSQISSVYLVQLEDLMDRSVTQASTVTGRGMTAENFAGNASVQTSPTGKFGIVTYTFTWSNFSSTTGGLSVGDAFAGGLYLDKNSELVISYPHGYSVTTAEPAPDQEGSDSVMWYGEREFSAGEPQISLAAPTIPVGPVVAGILVVLVIVGGGIGVYFYRKRNAVSDPDDDPGEVGDTSVPPLSATDLATMEEKILHLLQSHGGEQFQSEIVRELGVPKSTISSTLNDLHQRGVIQKVRKGRENLIRLAGEKK